MGQLTIRSGKNWTSHMPSLIKLVQNTEGPILELGSGPYSTPILHWLCSVTGRRLITYENVESYYKFARQFQTKYHSIRFIKSWDEVPVKKYSIVMIDHEPSERRVVDIERFKDSDYLIVHDTEDKMEYLYGFSKIYHLFKNRHDFTSGNRTSILSNKSLDFMYE
jgi:hypothetical protein